MSVSVRDLPFACDIVGAGSPALLLPALSSVSTRQEMIQLAERLGGDRRCVVADWPGFAGTAATRPLSPAVLDAFLDRLLDALDDGPLLGIAAGHGATFLVKAARRHPGRFARLVLVAPTWRGPLPTMTRGRRPVLCTRVRAAIEAPGVGTLLYRLNLSRPILGRMMRAHVYADAAKVTAALLAAKGALARRPGNRLATAAFVSGGLDPVASRAAFLALFGAGLPPVLMLRPRGAPPRSGAEMDALAATGLVETVAVDGALAPHEENPDGLAAAIAPFLRGSAMPAWITIGDSRVEPPPTDPRR